MRPFPLALTLAALLALPVAAADLARDAPLGIARGAVIAQAKPAKVTFHCDEVLLPASDGKQGDKAVLGTFDLGGKLYTYRCALWPSRKATEWYYLSLSRAPGRHPVLGKKAGAGDPGPLGSFPTQGR